jgi:hypothetical protein
MNLFKELVQSKSYQQWNADNSGQVYIFKVQHYKGRKKELVDTFIKIGFSKCQDLAHRIAYMPTCYSVEVVDSAIFDRETALHTEQLIHKYLRQFSYVTKLKRWSGKDECYTEALITKYPDLTSIIQAATKPAPIRETTRSL